MAKILWDQTGERTYETGIDHGVLYQKQADGSYTDGVAWNGLTGVTQSPSGAEPSPIYADNIKYLTLMSAEEFGGTIEAYGSPIEFDVNDGTASPLEGLTIGQQPRKPFGFSYRTILGNDTDKNEFGYSLKLVYDALAAPSEKAYATINESPEAMTLSWTFTTTPVEVTGFKPTAILTVNSTVFTAAKMKALEDVLYGTETEEARLPLPAEVITLLTT